MAQFKAPKDTIFQIEGDTNNLTLTPVEGGDGVVLDVAYGLIVSEETGEVKGHRFVVSRTETVMGKEMVMSSGSATVQKAAEMFIKSNLQADPDEYDVNYDEDDEFFDQKYSAPKIDKDDVWHNDKFAANLAELDQMRGQAEHALETVAESDENAQEDRLALARVLERAYELCGYSRKALNSWALGRDGEGENMKQLAQLGKGENALTEAMRLAQISDMEYRVLPISVTSGKAVDRHISQSIKAIVENSALNKQSEFPGVNYNGEHADADGVDVLLRRIAKQAFDVSNALDANDEGEFDVSLDDVAAAVDEMAGAHVAEYLSKYDKKTGIRISTYDAQQYSVAKLAYGAVRVSSAGAGLFKAAVDALHKADDYLSAGGDDAQKKHDEVIARLFKTTSGNTLVKEASKAYAAHKAAIAKEAANRNVVAAVTKQSKTAFNELEPHAAAARLYYEMRKHPEADAVEAALKAIIAQGVTIAA